MQKDEYLQQLEISLTSLSQTDKAEILSDYKEHYEIGLLNGRTEEEISQALGDPRTIGREYAALTLVKRAEEAPSAGGIGRALLATIGLGLFNLIIVLIPFLIILCLLAVFLVIAFSLTCAGPILTGYGFLEMTNIFPGTLPVSSPAAVFIGIGITCLGLIGILSEFWLVRLLYRLGIRYLKWNIAVIHGSEKL